MSLVQRFPRLERSLLAASFLFLFLGLLSSVHLADAQVIASAEMSGLVTDASGAVVPTAKVTLENLDTHTTQTASVTSTGEYVFTALPPGHYQVKVEAQGFKTFVVSNVTLAAGDKVREDATMQVGAVSESVEVQGQAPALQTDSATFGTLVTTQAVQDLPLNGRNFMTLVQLTAGATEGLASNTLSGNRPDDRRMSSVLVINGASVPDWLLDGMDNFERIQNDIVVKPSVDGIAEIRVLTNDFDASIGRSANGVVSITTKSGTDAFHGTLYEYFRNDALDARNFFSRTKAEYRFNDFGGSIGGPIKKNKTFGFFDYERYFLRQGQTYTSTIPTLAMRNGNFNGVALIFDPATTVPNPAKPGTYMRTPFMNDTIPANRISPIATNFMNLYPVPQTSSLVNNYTSNLKKTQDYDTYDIRVDHHFNELNTFFARYSYNDGTTYTPGAFPIVNGIDPGGNAGVFPGPALQRSQAVQANFVHIFTPTLLLELKAGYQRFALDSQSVDLGQNLATQFGIPGANHDYVSTGLPLMQPAGYETLGGASFVPLIEFENTFDYQGSLSWTKASHSLRMGAALIRRQVIDTQSSYPRGAYNFDGNATNDPSGAIPSGNAIASWLLGFPSVGQLNENLTWNGYRFWEPNVWFQDDWRVNRKLTLNLGIRYDVFTPLTEVHNQISNFDPATNRIIVAGVNGVSRTAGVKTDYSDVAPRFGFAYQPAQSWVVRGGFGIAYVPEFTGSNGLLKNAPFTDGYSFIQNQILPTYTLAQGFPPPMPESVTNPTTGLIAVAENFQSTRVMQYNLTVQKEFGGNVVSAAYVAALTRHGVLSPNIDQPLPAPGNTNLLRPYYSLFPNISTISYQASSNNANYHSMQLVFERRLRHGLTINSNFVWAHALTGGAPGQLINNWHLEHGSTSTDIRLRWTATADYQLPFAAKSNKWLNGVIGGWDFNAIAVVASGLPFTVTNATPRENISSAATQPGGVTVSDRPDRIAGCSGYAANPTVTNWLNAACFFPQPLYTAGNSGPNILYGPPNRHLDIALFKLFPIRESVQLQLRGEAYNLTNTPSFANPGSAFGSGTFGVISGTVGTPRQLGFMLKLLF
jgi:Carboxypeptidase regulatory-like domain/TonB dependent receptor-like, beta-barrel